MVQQIVLPIKDSNVLKMVQDTLLDSFRAGRSTVAKIAPSPPFSLQIFISHSNQKRQFSVY